jgi:DNA-binding NtrC family response regulator
MLAEHFYREATREHSEPGRFEIDAELALAMTRYAWPGNARELSHLIATLSSKPPPYRLEDLPERARERLLAAAGTSAAPRLSLTEDRERIIVLIKGGISQGQLADLLGVDRRTLVRELTAAGIEHPWSKK